ncbi:hypothetical protein D3C76_790310 [compost metagenome]
MLTEPPSCFTSALATSMPTPRPEICVTFSAVLKPASRMNCRISWSVRSLSAVIRPRSMALRRTASRRMPAPSSARVRRMSPPSRARFRRMVPTSGLPLARRASVDSMPWSTALRSMCSSGATIRSSTVRSISPSALLTTKSTCLPSSLATCRTMRRRRGTRRSNGTMRVRIRPSCSSVLTRACCSSRVSASRFFAARVSFRSNRSEADSNSARDSCCSCEWRSISSGSKSS